MKPITRSQILTRIDYALLDSEDWIKDSDLLTVLSGSYAYGTNTANSDLDIKSIVIPPLKDYYFGNKRFESLQCSSGNNDSKNTKDDIDLTLYSIKRFFHLASQGNTSALEMLFVDESDIVLRTSYGQELLDHKNLFLTNQIYKSFGGFAYSDKMRLLKSIENNKTYDGKHLTHVLRLYQTAAQAFREGQMFTKRSSAEIEILVKAKLEEYTNDEAIQLVVDAQEDFELAYENSILPERIDRKAVDQLLIDMTTRYFKYEQPL